MWKGFLSFFEYMCPLALINRERNVSASKDGV